MKYFKYFELIAALFFLSGCATVNFSANYYTPPADYQAQVKKTWDEFLAKAPLKYEYTLVIIPGRQSHMGIPEISSGQVILPDSYIKYVYQNFYDDRGKILICIFAHEVVHSEYGIGDKPVKAHYEADKKAIALLENSAQGLTAEDFYKSQVVLKKYWFARKGILGHAFNLGWNLASGVSMAYGGPGNFRNWYATDLDWRLSRMSRDYKIRKGICYPRSKNKTGSWNPLSINKLQDPVLKIIC